MREGIHPEYHQATVTCNCGNTFVTGSLLSASQKQEARCLFWETCLKAATGWDGRIDHYNALKVDFAAGSAPDVIGIAPGADLEQYKSQLAPMADYAKAEWGDSWEDRSFRNHILRPVPFTSSCMTPYSR